MKAALFVTSIISFLGLVFCSHQKPPASANLQTDSLSKYCKFSHLTSFSLSKDLENDTTLFALDSVQRVKLTDNLYPVKLVKPYYSAYFYSYQGTIDGTRYMVVYLTADDYQSLVLLSVRDKVIDQLNLAGGICSGPIPGKFEELKYCPVRTSRIVNDSIVSISLVTKVVYSAQYKSNATVDSLSDIFLRTKEGLFILVKHDSIRY